MMVKKIRTISSLAVVLMLLLALPMMAQEAQVTTLSVKASKMSAPVECTVVVPVEYNDADCQNTQYPVLYLLHGHGGDHMNWVNKKSDLPDLASQYGVIIVCPNGRASWYWDSPVDSESQFETFVAKDLVEFVDNNFRTIPEPGMRAITGLSMGGHGALFVGLRHPDVFGSCGSMSGGVDIRPFPDSWGMKKVLGDYESNKEVWDSHTVIELVKGGLTTTQNIAFECGVDDFFSEVNRNLHKAMVDAKIKHDYTERPGGHTWAYWCNALDYQMLFFSKAFDACLGE